MSSIVRRRTHHRAHTFLVLALSAVMVGCGGSNKPLSLSSTCGDYFKLDHAARYDAAQRLSVTAHAEDAGNPLWGPQADAACGALGNSALLGRVFHGASPAPSPSPVAPSASTSQIVARAVPIAGTSITPTAMALAARTIKDRLAGAHLAARVATNTAELTATVASSDVGRAKQLIEEIGLLRFRQVLGEEPGSGSGEQGAHGSRASAQPVPGSSSSNPSTVQAAFDSYDCTNGTAPTQGLDSPEDYIIACDDTGSTKFLLAPAAVEGSQIANTNAVADTTTNQWYVQLSFSGSGKNDWYDLTKKAYESDPPTSANYTPMSKCATVDIKRGCNAVAVVLDGVVSSAPYSNADGIAGGQTQITGQFTQQQADDLANVLKFGALPVRFEIQTVTTG